MAEYIPKYPSKEEDDSNKTSSELLAETLKPIYVPQDLMLAWESHLASYSRDTNVLLDQVKDSELALNTQYQSLLARVQKYEQMLQDITMDSNEFTMDTDVVNFTGWNILAQASYWDYLLRKEITKLSDQIKSVEFKGALVADVSDAVLESLSTGNQYISNIIGTLTDSPLIRELDSALSGTSIGLSNLRLEHEKLKAKQYADALALADQNGEIFDQLTVNFNNLISEQIDKISEEATTRTRVFQELEDGLTVESQLRQEGHEVIASQVFALKASTEKSIAGIKEEYSTIAGTDEAITTALKTYTAKVEGTLANITTDYVSYANLDSALVSKTDELLAIVNNNISKLNITNEITAGLSSVKAVSTVTVDLNGVVTGYGLISELEDGIVKSAFGVNADTFYVGKPTDKVKPFVVTSVPTTIDGIDFPAGTWINSAIIANATIGSAHIKDASITNAKIKELDASKITTGVLNANRVRVGPTSTFDDGYNPASKARTFVTQPTVPYSVGDIWKNGTSTYICKTHRVAGSFTASEWEKVGDVTSENTALDVVNVNGVSAATVATNAATGKTLSDNIMSDLIITPVEKSGLLNEWNRIKAEYTNIVTQGTATGVSTATLTTNYNALNGIVPRIELDILASMTTNYNMTAANRDAFKAKLKLYFDTAEATAKDITNKVKGIATSKAMTYLSQPITPYTAGDIWKSGTSTYICITGRSSGAFIAGDWVKVGDVTSENTAANANQLGGTAASVINQNIANAAQAAQAAADAAGNKGEVIFGSTTPAVAKQLPQNLWIDTTNNLNTPKRWNGTAWLAVTDKAAIDAKTAADAAAVAAKAANDQVDLWKFTGTVEIDGGKIRADTVTAAQISVNELSAISANLGTIKVGSANIDTLAVDSIHIKDRAITSPIGMQQTLSNVAFSGSVAAGWTKEVAVAFPGVETITAGSFCTLFFRSDVRFYSPNVPNPLTLEIYLGDGLIGTIGSRVVVDGSVTKRVWVVTGPSGEYITMATGVTTGAYIDEQGAIQVAFSMPYGINASSALKFKFINSAVARSVVISGSYVNLYLVEFKK